MWTQSIHKLGCSKVLFPFRGISGTYDEAPGNWSTFCESPTPTMLAWRRAYTSSGGWASRVAAREAAIAAKMALTFYGGSALVAAEHGAAWAAAQNRP